MTEKVKPKCNKCGNEAMPTPTEITGTYWCLDCAIKYLED